MAIKNPIA